MRRAGGARSGKRQKPHDEHLKAPTEPNAMIGGPHLANIAALELVSFRQVTAAHIAQRQQRQQHLVSRCLIAML